MKVLKFGGTSVGTVESLRNVKAIVEGCDEPVVVVVSALGGITDCLIATGREASRGDGSFRASLEGIVNRHHAVVNGIVPPGGVAEVLGRVDPLLDELTAIYERVDTERELSRTALDAIVSYGELISSHIVTAIIPGSVRLDSREFIKTRTNFDKHILDNEATAPLIHSFFDNAGADVIIVPGFISTDSRTGIVTNLGRGGSDYTAAIIAAELNAHVLEIWTDVDGFMTADPRVIDTAYVIDRMTFVEAMELCNFGAKVIYPPTIYPVFHKNIPILIKNTFNPSAPGTLVCERRKNEAEAPVAAPAKGLSSINDTCLVTVNGFGMVGMTGISSRIFTALARHGISVFMVNQASGENNMSFAVRNDSATLASEVLGDEFAAELSDGRVSDITVRADLATVALVGENMSSNSIIAGKLFNTLSRNGIGVIAYAHGASGTNISFVIPLGSLRKAMKEIHDCFFLPSAGRLNLFVYGGGDLADELLTSINGCRADRSDKSGAATLVGVADGAVALFRPEGIDPAAANGLLREQGVEMTPGEIAGALGSLPGCDTVFVDCSAVPGMAEVYETLLNQKVNVITANLASYRGLSADAYSRLTAIAAGAGVSFTVESGICSGFPVAAALENLVKAGDTIERVTKGQHGAKGVGVNPREIMAIAAPDGSDTIHIITSRRGGSPDISKDYGSPVIIRGYGSGDRYAARGILDDIVNMARQSARRCHS